MGPVYGVFQAHHMIVDSTKGLSTSMFLFATLFILVNLCLALAAHKATPSRAMMQVIVIYVLGVLTYSTLLGVMVVRAERMWDSLDTLTSSIVGVGLLCALIYVQVSRLRVLDPLMKGVYSLTCKSVPQFVLAWKVFYVSGTGLSLTAVIIFHMLTCMRIYQIFHEAWVCGWDRNRRGLALAEVGNELSWVLVTIAFVYVTYIV